MITILFVLSWVVYIAYGLTDHLPEWFPGADFLFDFSRQIGLSIIASFIFYILIEYIPTLKKNKKFTRIVLKQIEYPVAIHLRLLMYMYKSSLSEKPESLPQSIDELFSNDYFDIVEGLDLNSQAPVVKEQTWTSYIYQECLSLSNEIQSLLIKYSHYLNEDLIELMEKINRTAFMKIVLLEGMLRINVGGCWKHEDNIFKNDYIYINNKNAPNLFFKSKLADENNKHILDDHIALFLELIEIHNIYNDKNKIKLDIMLWSDTIAPLFGDSKNGIYSINN